MEAIKYFPFSHLGLLVEMTERSEFWLSILINSGCLSEESPEAKEAHALNTAFKLELESQGRTVRTLTEIKFIHGEVIFPEQKP